MQEVIILENVNNDGKKDIVDFGNIGAYVFESTASSFTSASLWVMDTVMVGDKLSIANHHYYELYLL